VLGPLLLDPLYQDPKNYYRFSWDKQRSYGRVTKKVNGVESLVAEDKVPYIVGRSYQLKIDVSGSSIQIHVDGRLVFSVSDRSLSSGTIALYSWSNAGSYFDDIKVID
jgi:hypothetical protein